MEMETTQARILVERYFFSGGIMFCPRCGKEIIEPRYSLSRHDNKTHICPDCGVQEALETFFGSIYEGKIYWTDRQRSLIQAEPEDDA
jgi:predicted RNA-binding Zn-ribbon protein involved in translation (DUF1610 family)